jgi:hypothetical protein
LITVRKATPNDCKILAPILREPDKAEASAYGFSVLDALITSLSLSEEAYVGEAEGQPFCLFGVSAEGGLWMVGTEDIRRHRVHFLRHSKEWLKRLATEHPVLWNWIDSRNTLHLKYLSWLGCKLTGRQILIGPNQIPFLEFLYQSCASS